MATDTEGLILQAEVVAVDELGHCDFRWPISAAAQPRLSEAGPDIALLLTDELDLCD
jgi:hypothetical protein